MRIGIATKNQNCSNAGRASADYAPDANEVARRRATELYAEDALEIPQGHLEVNPETGLFDLDPDWGYETGEAEELVRNYMDVVEINVKGSDSNSWYRVREARNILIAICELVRFYDEPMAEKIDTFLGLTEKA